MAPEQLERKSADARTDIFAFGALLYEMLSGEKAFKGESQASLISAIMSSSPPTLSALRLVSPSALGRVVEGCLEKDADDRLQSAADLKRNLQWIQEDGLGTAATAQEPAPRRNRERLALIAAGLLIGSIAAWFLARSPSAPPTPVKRFALPFPEEQTWVPSGVVISADGSRFVHVASVGDTQQLYLHEMDQLASPRHATDLDFSY